MVKSHPWSFFFKSSTWGQSLMADFLIRLIVGFNNLKGFFDLYDSMLP